ncbi:MAG: anthranilate phosphoribosyltransferase, partial [Dehalococcoidia bacterium]
FNVLGPLSNPARPKRQLVGVGSKALGALVAEALALRGMERALVVHSSDGLDEISPAAPTHGWLVEAGRVSERELRPREFGLLEHPLSAVLGGGPEENAATLKAVLDGAEGPMADFTLMNAAAALYVAGVAEDFSDGMLRAREAIASGRAKAVQEEYVALTQEVMA